MSIVATCATIAAILATAQGGETIELQGDCRSIEIKKNYPQPITVDAEGATVRGLTISGSNVRWRSGRVMAAGGAFASARPGYGIFVSGQRVSLENVQITAAKKGIVLDRAEQVSITNSRFNRLGEDGLIASRTSGLRVIGNRFAETLGRASTCVVGGNTTVNVAKAKCAGAWTDGTHADAVQMRNGVKDAVIEGNIIRGPTQGITQMDTTGDAPLERVVIRGNSVITSTYHPITLANCVGCRIEGNEVRKERGSTKKAVIIAGKAARCGNIAPDDRYVEPTCRKAS